jgi:hypothetical protein
MSQTIENTGGAEEREGFEPSPPNPPTPRIPDPSPTPLNPRAVPFANSLPEQHSAARPRSAPVSASPCLLCGAPSGAPCVYIGTAHARYVLHRQRPRTAPPGGGPNAEAGRPEAQGGSGAQPPPGCGHGCHATLLDHVDALIRAHAGVCCGYEHLCRFALELRERRRELATAVCTCDALRAAVAVLRQAGCGIAVQGPGCALHGWAAVRS